MDTVYCTLISNPVKLTLIFPAAAGLRAVPNIPSPRASVVLLAKGIPQPTGHLSKG